MAVQLADNPNSKGNMWVWDSGASKHITGHIGVPTAKQFMMRKTKK
jgi:hypothetical protein